MAKLTIKRNSEWYNKFGNVTIYLDGNKIGKIKDGETKDFEITPGEHELKAKMLWLGCQTINFTSTDTENCKFELSGSKSANQIFAIVALVSLSGKIGKRFLSDDNNMLLSILSATILISYFILMRNKYLTLNEL